MRLLISFGLMVFTFSAFGQIVPPDTNGPCKADFKRFCQGRYAGRGLVCLAAFRNQLSPECAAVAREPIEKYLELKSEKSEGPVTELRVGSFAAANCPAHRAKFGQYSSFEIFVGGLRGCNAEITDMPPNLAKALMSQVTITPAIDGAWSFPDRTNTIKFTPNPSGPGWQQGVSYTAQLSKPIDVTGYMKAPLRVNPFVMKFSWSPIHEQRAAMEAAVRASKPKGKEALAELFRSGFVREANPQEAEDVFRQIELKFKVDARKWPVPKPFYVVEKNFEIPDALAVSFIVPAGGEPPSGNIGSNLIFDYNHPGFCRGPLCQGFFETVDVKIAAPAPTPTPTPRGKELPPECYSAGDSIAAVSELCRCDGTLVEAGHGKWGMLLYSCDGVIQINKEAFEKIKRKKEAEQRQILSVVNATVAKCNAQFKTLGSVEEVRKCLNPAIILVPDNAGVLELLKKARAEKKEK